MYADTIMLYLYPKIKALINFTLCVLQCALLAVALSGCATKAWYIKETEGEVTIDFGNMEVASRVYFDGVPSNHAVNDPDMYGFYTAKGTPSETSEPNYLANLRIDIYFKGISSNYLRVYLAESWVMQDSEGEIILRSIFTKYLCENSLWIDNRQGTAATSNDGYYYYNNLLSARDDPYEICYRPDESGGGDGLDYNLKAGWITMPLITGADSAWLAGNYQQAGTYLKIKVLAEAVQINRYKQIWGIDALPSR